MPGIVFLEHKYSIILKYSTRKNVLGHVAVNEFSASASQKVG